MSSRTDITSGFPWPWLIGATLLVALMLRIANLGSGLWYDEIVTLVFSVRLPLLAIPTGIQDLNVHPLYSLLAHLSVGVFGESPWAVRLPAAAFGVASIGMAYALGAALTSRGEAWAGATILAVSYHHVWFSQNARGYTLLAFLVLASTFVLLRALAGGGRRDLFLYGGLSVAGIYTHLTMAFVVTGQLLAVAAWTLTRRQHATHVSWSKIGQTWIATALASGILYLPLLPGVVTSMTGEAQQATAAVATPTWAVREVFRELASGPGIGVCVMAAFGLAGAIALFRERPLAMTVLLAPLVAIAVGLVLLDQPFRPRFFFFASGAMAIAFGRGIGVLAERTRPGHLAVPAKLILALTLPIAGLTAAGLPSNYRFPKQDFEAAITFLETQQREGAHIAAAGPACLPLGAYYGKDWPCLSSAREWRSMRGAFLVTHTLSDYTSDPGLRDRLQSSCAEVTRFRGTVGGGDLVVCRPF